MIWVVGGGVLHDLAEMAIESSSWKETLETPPAGERTSVYNDSSRNSPDGCFCRAETVFKEFASGQEADPDI